MSKPMDIIEQRMIELMEWAVANKIAPTEGEYWAMIVFPRNNLSNVKKGIYGFTKDQIRNACKSTGASADWVMGLENNMFRQRQVSPLQLLKEATKAVELALSEGKNGSTGVNKKVTNRSAKQEK